MSNSVRPLTHHEIQLSSPIPLLDKTNNGSLLLARPAKLNNVGYFSYIIDLTSKDGLVSKNYSIEQHSSEKAYIMPYVSRKLPL